MFKIGLVGFSQGM